MLQKSFMAMVAAVAIGAAALLAPDVASARSGWHGFHGGHSYGGFRFYGAPVYYGGYSCWRWVPTRFGYAKVWVC